MDAQSYNGLQLLVSVPGRCLLDEDHHGGPQRVVPGEADLAMEPQPSGIKGREIAQGIVAPSMAVARQVAQPLEGSEHCSSRGPQRALEFLERGDPLSSKELLEDLRLRIWMWLWHNYDSSCHEVVIMTRFDPREQPEPSTSESQIRPPDPAGVTGRPEKTSCAQHSESAHPLALRALRCHMPLAGLRLSDRPNRLSSLCQFRA